MTLDRERMIAQCLDGFFLALNTKNMARLRQTFTPECQMIIPSSSLFYKHADDVMIHLEDFAVSFTTINFHDFIIAADPAAARVAATFTVTLTDPAGAVLEMRNANFFEFAEDHRIARVLIIATQPLDAGFQAGRS